MTIAFYGRTWLLWKDNQVFFIWVRVIFIFVLNIQVLAFTKSCSHLSTFFYDQKHFDCPTRDQSEPIDAFERYKSDKFVFMYIIYNCAKTKGNTLVHKECTRFKLGVHY